MLDCQKTVILSKNLVFTLQAATTPTGDVNYYVYEDITAAPILSSTMTKDFASKTGLCIAQIACTAGNGFEAYKSYTIVVTYTIAGVTMIQNANFVCMPDYITDTTFIKNVLEGDYSIDTTTTPWNLVVKIKDTDTELIRKQLRDISGDNLGSISTVIGSAKES